MATTYKTFLADDITSTRTLLHENIPITGAIVSGTYSDGNIKNYSHKRFQSVYDYPYLSSSANHIFDISAGFAPDSGLSGSTSGHDDVAEKIQMYNQMSQVMVGYDATGSIMQFDRDGDIVSGGEKLKECVFLNFSRLLVKDEIKKGSVSLLIGTGSHSTPFDGGTLEVTDYGAANEYRINSPAGEYGILYTGSSPVEGTGVGLVYYQAGVLVLTASIFGGGDYFSETHNRDAVMSGSTIDVFADNVRRRIDNISFNNTVELNSTIYFCRINHNEYNYSSNPTYLSESRVRVKSEDRDDPISYITTVGLYSSNNELLAVAKLSEPLKKTPQNTLILRTRLDY